MICAKHDVQYDVQQGCWCCKLNAATDEKVLAFIVSHGYSQAAAKKMLEKDREKITADYLASETATADLTEDSSGE